MSDIMVKIRAKNGGYFRLDLNNMSPLEAIRAGRKSENATISTLNSASNPLTMPPFKYNQGILKMNTYYKHEIQPSFNQLAPLTFTALKLVMTGSSTESSWRPSLPAMILTLRPL